MANSNVNIASKLYAYIRHGQDIDANIKKVYNSSMIFIGDEQQIYVPVMDTYVGIGMTAYNATLNRIKALEDRIDDVVKTLSSDMVSKIYANYSSFDLTYNTYVDLAEYSEDIRKFTYEFDSDDYKVSDQWGMNNEVTFRGVNNYDPTTGWARTVENPYTITDKDGVEYPLNYVGEDGQGANATYLYSNFSYQYDNPDFDSNSPEDPITNPRYITVSVGNKQPNSGITVTPVWGVDKEIINPLTYQVIKKKFGNTLLIDDKLTWSYMTSAYAYTLDYSTKYTNSEIDRMYHNLLGEPEEIYKPVSLKSVITDITNEFNALTIYEQDHYNVPGFSLVKGDSELTPAGSEKNEANVLIKWPAYVTYDYVLRVKNGDYYWAAYDASLSYEFASIKDSTLAYAPFDFADNMVPLLDDDDQTETDFSEYAKIPDGESEPANEQVAALISKVNDTDPSDPNYNSDVNDTNIAIIRYYADEVSTVSSHIIENFPQIYVKDTQYNSSYNMNIKDGIETLKEVAYLFDLLTDGTLGSTTYLTYEQFQNVSAPIPDGETEHVFDAEHWHLDGNHYYYAPNGYPEIENGVYNYSADVPVITYTILSSIYGSTPKPEDTYVFYTNTGENAENLGIQIAYSIAGNKVEIDDLHKHAELLEKGETTLRSIQSRSTQFAKIKLDGGIHDWTDTDTKQGHSDFGTVAGDSNHPNAANTGNRQEHDYQVGDINITVSLDTAITYSTTYTSRVIGEPKNYYYKDEYNVVWFGAYTLADMDNLPAEDNGTYFYIDTNNIWVPDIVEGSLSNSTFVNYSSLDDAESDLDEKFVRDDYGKDDAKACAYFTAIATNYEPDPTKQVEGTQYWYKPGSKLDNGVEKVCINDETQNLKYVSLTVEEFLSLADDKEIVEGGLTKGQVDTIYVKDKRDESGKTYVQYATGQTPAAALSNFISFYQDGEGGPLVISEGEGQDAHNVEVCDELKPTSKIYFIDETKIVDVKVHAALGKNAVATTEWVGAYVDATVEEISEALEEILDKAKQYTNKKIEELQTNYKYTDFDEYWAYFISNLSGETYEDPITHDEYPVEKVSTPGTPEYKEVYDIEFERYKGNQLVYTYYASENNHGDYRLSYITNSQYAYNVVEENGIVSIEHRELPEDKVRVKTTIWGDERNENAAYIHQYADVVLDPEEYADDDANAEGVQVTEILDDDTLFMSLYRWMVVNNNATVDSSDDVKYPEGKNQLFVIDGKTYRPVAEDKVVPETDINYVNALMYPDLYFENVEDQPSDSLSRYYIMDENGNFTLLSEYRDNVVTLTNIHNGAEALFNYADRNNKYWRKVYEITDNYVEINLQEAEDPKAGANDEFTSNVRNELNIGISDTQFYKLSRVTDSNDPDYGKVHVQKFNYSDPLTAINWEDENNATAHTLKYISVKATEAGAKYLTVDNKHFSYVNNGNGENQFEITANITKLEDATSTNTGFADAYDVQTYVKNFFSWVDISATLTDDIIDHSDLYYKMISFNDFKAYLQSLISDGKDNIGSIAVYKRTFTDNTPNYAKQDNLYISWYWKDNDAVALGDTHSYQFAVNNIKPSDLIADIYTNTPADFAEGPLYNNIGGTALTNDIDFTSEKQHEGADWEDLTNEQVGNHNKVTGNFFYKQFYIENVNVYKPVIDEANKTSNYFIRLEEPRINPLNLSLTSYGVAAN